MFDWGAVALGIWGLIVVVRVTPMWSMSWWLLRNGAAVADAAAPLGGDVEQNYDAFWTAFRKKDEIAPHRFLAFGAKDVRLDVAISKARSEGKPLRHLASWTFRFFWRGYAFVTLSSIALIVLAYLPNKLSALDGVLAVVVGMLLLIGMVAIAAEMVVLVISLGAWLPYYHRRPPKKDFPEHHKRMVEAISLIQISAGASLITLFATAGVMCVAARQTTATNLHMSGFWLLGFFQSVVHSISLLGFDGSAFNTQTWLGTLLGIVVLPMILAYVAFLIPTAASVVRASNEK